MFAHPWNKRYVRASLDQEIKIRGSVKNMKVVFGLQSTTEFDYISSSFLPGQFVISMVHGNYAQ